VGSAVILLSSAARACLRVARWHGFGRVRIDPARYPRVSVEVFGGVPRRLVFVSRDGELREIALPHLRDSQVPSQVALLEGAGLAVQVRRE